MGQEGLKLTDELKLIKGFTGHSFPLLLKQELPSMCNCSFITMWKCWAPSCWDSDSVPYQSVSCSLQVLSQNPHCISSLACRGEIQLDIISILLIFHSTPPLGLRSTKAQQLHMNVKRCKGIISRKALIDRGKIPYQSNKGGKHYLSPNKKGGMPKCLR